MSDFPRFEEAEEVKENLDIDEAVEIIETDFDIHEVREWLRRLVDETEDLEDAWGYLEDIQDDFDEIDGEAAARLLIGIVEGQY